MQAPRGETHTALDPEGRFIVPRPLRDDLGLGSTNLSLVASIEPSGCLALRPLADWQVLRDHLKKNARSKRARKAARLFSSMSQQVTHDRQGRVKVPEHVLQRVGIEKGDEERKKVSVVLDGEDVQVWSTMRWAEQMRSLSDGEYEEGIDEILDGAPLEGGQG